MKLYQVISNWSTGDWHYI